MASRTLGKGLTDLTHTFRAGFPVYTGDEPTRRTLKNYVPDGFYSQEWTFGEHSGPVQTPPATSFPAPAACRSCAPTSCSRPRS